jgi:hypothetical protein
MKRSGKLVVLEAKTFALIAIAVVVVVAAAFIIPSLMKPPIAFPANPTRAAQPTHPAGSGHYLYGNIQAPDRHLG